MQSQLQEISESQQDQEVPMSVEEQLTEASGVGLSHYLARIEKIGLPKWHMSNKCKIYEPSYNRVRKKLKQERHVCAKRVKNGKNTYVKRVKNEKHACLKRVKKGKHVIELSNKI
jgi:hypothetical protein